jgi:hypothetical protein
MCFGSNHDHGTAVIETEKPSGNHLIGEKLAVRLLSYIKLNPGTSRKDALDAIANPTRAANSFQNRSAALKVLIRFGLVTGSSTSLSVNTNV